MADNRRPRPLFEPPSCQICPVCGNVSYSRSGIHPQCAQNQADSRQGARLKRVAKRRSGAEQRIVSHRRTISQSNPTGKLPEVNE
jgi:hypothetical protein